MNDQRTIHTVATWRGRAVRGGLAALLGLMAGNVVMAQTVSYPRDPDTVVARYSLEIGELEHPDPGPSVLVYGNGRAVVHIPPYMTNGGDYTVQLSDAEMSSLMSTVAADEVLQFDQAAVRQAKKDSLQFNRGGGAAGEQVLFEVTDPSVTVIEVRAQAGGGGGGAGQAAEVAKTVRWSGLEADAQQFPDVRAIQKLSAAKNRLRAVMERPDLQRVE